MKKDSHTSNVLTNDDVIIKSRLFFVPSHPFAGATRLFISGSGYLSDHLISLVESREGHRFLSRDPVNPSRFERKERRSSKFFFFWYSH